MPVFLSHKREDKEAAVRVANFLTTHRVTCYLAILDPAIQTTDDITSTLMVKVRGCTHLMAVVSEYTQKSWWVPFEVGVASELDRRITTFRLTAVPLPDFLTKWPILRNEQDLLRFVEHYRRDDTVSLTEGKTHSAYRSADQFHRSLKAALAQ
jgi:hypothetical protein